MMSFKKLFQLPFFFLKSTRKHIFFFYFLCITCRVAIAGNQKVEDYYWVEAVEIVTNGQLITVNEQEKIKKIAQQGGSLIFELDQAIKNATKRLQKNGYKASIEVIKQQEKIKLQIKLLDTYPELSTVQFKGITEEEEEKLISQITQEIGTLFTTEEKEKVISQISQEIGTLLTTEEKRKLISQILQERDTPLTIEEEEKLISQILQERDPLLTIEEEEELISQITLEKYILLTPSTIKRASQIIRNHFLEEGFANIKLLINKKTPSFKITKGNKVYIKNITFEGNEHCTNLELANLLTAEKSIGNKLQYILYSLRDLSPTQAMETLKGIPSSLYNLSPITATSYIWYFFRPKAFVKKTLDKEVNNLIQYYQSKGFADVEISCKIYKLKKEEDRFKISFKVKEGQRYKIGSIVWEGNKLFKASELNEALDIKEGDIYNPIHLQEQLNPNGASNLHRIYTKKEWDLTPIGLSGIRCDDKVNLVLKIKELPAPTINKINIDANIDPLTVRAMLKQNGLEEGAKMTREKLQASGYYMATSGLFEPEEIKFITKELEDGSINLECCFKSPPLAYALAGVLDYPKLEGKAYSSRFDLKKIFKGKMMSGKDEVSLEIKGSLNTFVDKSLCSYPAQPGEHFVSLSYKNDWVLFGEHFYTFGCGIGNRPFIYLGTKWNKEYYRYIARIEAKAKLKEWKKPIKGWKEPTIALNCKRDSTNDLLYPTKGDIIELEPTLDINDNKIKIVGNYSFFKTTSFSPSLRPFTIKSSSSMGGNFIGNSLESFSFGARGTFEEFSTNFVPLRGYRINNKIALNKGAGEYYFKQSFELRYPIGNPTTNYVFSFVDMGLIGGSQLLNYKTGGSFGIGYRYLIRNFLIVRDIKIGVDYVFCKGEKGLGKLQFSISKEV